MILTGMLLLAIGAVDLVRQFVTRGRRWIGYTAVAVVVIVIGSAADAPASMLVAAGGGAAWLLAMPDTADARRSSWPVLVLAAASIACVVLLGDRDRDVAQLHTPFGPLSPDLTLLVLGVVIFLLESGNVVVRAALAGEHTWKPSPTSEGFRGGRLIGPLERVLAFLLMLVPAYSLLAAVLAAKGIVRFPEISKDGETGARAEYFLVGSLVSWVLAVGGALLVWWAANV